MVSVHRRLRRPRRHRHTRPTAPAGLRALSIGSSRRTGISVKALPVLLLLTGCGVQATGGVSHTPRDGAAAAGALTLTSQATRTSNPVVAVRGSGIIENGFYFRNVGLHTGWDWVALPGYLATEVGPDLAAGKPIGHVYNGVGAYLGLSNTTRIRLTKGADREPTYNILYPMVELVLSPRVGAWGPPEGAANPDLFVEWGVELGFRFAFGSDLVSPRLGEIEDGEQPARAEQEEAP